MPTNYELQQYFLDYIKQFAISNPDREITKNFIYSRLAGFNIQNIQGPYEDARENFSGWLERYKYYSNINVFEIKDRKNFLWFANGEIKGNEIKLYIPLDKTHLKEGANQLFDFICTNSLEHQSKIADIIRNDNIVVRVNKMEDAKTIIDFVSENSYLKEGLLKVNPFLPNHNGIGITMDNSYSFNGTLCNIIGDFLNQLRKHNRLDMFNVEELNKYIKSVMNNIDDPDLKDIYSLVSKTTEPDFKLDDFINHANYKLIDIYNSKRERIVDPKFYLERAVIITNNKYPQNTKEAILQYLKNNPNYFTNKHKAREGLIKYVRPGDVISLMRTKLNENKIQIPNTDNELVDQYLKIVLNIQRRKENDNSFEILKNAYLNTLKVYDERQARVAIQTLLQTGETHYFTNKFGDRIKLKELIKKQDIMRIIISNIDIENLNIKNIKEIVNRFEQSIFMDKKSKKTY